MGYFDEAEGELLVLDELVDLVFNIGIAFVLFGHQFYGISGGILADASANVHRAEPPCFQFPEHLVLACYNPPL